jgi:hypothetical protein
MGIKQPKRRTAFLAEMTLPGRSVAVPRFIFDAGAKEADMPAPAHL